MTLQIQKDGQFKQAQQQFSAIYPFLKIEAINKPVLHGKMMLSNKISSNHTKTSDTIQINIDKEKTVAGLEQEFFEKASVHIKLYRRFCNVWIETSLTDDWTLAQQNSEGELLSELNKMAV